MTTNIGLGCMGFSRAYGETSDATSVAVILFGVCFVFSILYQVFVLRRDVRGGATRMAG